MHCPLHYFDTLSIDKKHNSQNVLHDVVTKAHILFQLTLNREWGGGPRTQTKIFHNNKVILYWYYVITKDMHAPVIFWDHLREAWYLGSLNCLRHEILTFQYLGQLWSEMSKNIPSNYVSNDQVSNLSAIWSCVH